MDLLLTLILFPLNSPIALYALLFAVLVLSAIVLPVPEEATLLLGGYLAYLGFVDFWVVLIVLTAGIIVADIFGYLCGRFIGDWLYERIFQRFEWARTLLEKGQQAFSRYGERVVIFSRPMLGVRVAVPMLAGKFKMNFATFLLYDIVVTIPWTIVLVYLSYYLGSGFTFLLSEVHSIKRFVVAIIGGVISAYLIIRLVRKRRLRKEGKIL